jgi:hypothetical protein
MRDETGVTSKTAKIEEMKQTKEEKRGTSEL